MHQQRPLQRNQETFDRCESCKRQRTAGTFADVVLRTHPDFTPRLMGGSPAPPLPGHRARRPGEGVTR